MSTDIETLERATVDGVVPLRLEELPGWLLPLDQGEVNRAVSAVPLHHAEHATSVLAHIIERYHGYGLRPQFRLADVPGLSPLQAALAASGFEPRLPTYMQWIESSRIGASAHAPEVSLASAADEGWSQVFYTVAFSHGSPNERAARLARAQTTLYATLRVDSVPVSVGALTFARGLACVHSMRTTEAQRGRGYAGRVLGALGHAALQRGVQRVFLQVEEDSAAARGLYAKLGFTTLWRYRYWRQGLTG
jgi:GNAT superfamily N-acetyltransferase